MCTREAARRRCVYSSACWTGVSFAIGVGSDDAEADDDAEASADADASGCGEKVDANREGVGVVVAMSIGDVGSLSPNPTPGWFQLDAPLAPNKTPKPCNGGTVVLLALLPLLPLLVPVATPNTLEVETEAGPAAASTPTLAPAPAPPPAPAPAAPPLPLTPAPLALDARRRQVDEDCGVCAGVLAGTASGRGGGGGCVCLTVRRGGPRGGGHREGGDRAPTGAG